MNTSLYRQLYHAIDNNPSLDPLSLYFLGICAKYAPTSANLESIIKQLPLSFSNLYSIFRANGKEIGFLARNLVRVVYHIFLEEGVTEISLKSEMDLSVVEESTQIWFRDFELLKLLYPEISKAQWFLLGSIKANDASCDTLKLVRQIYIELLVQKARLDEAGRAELLSSHVKANPEQNLVVPPMATEAEPETRRSISSSRLSLLRPRNFNLRPSNRKSVIREGASKVTGSSPDQGRTLRRLRQNMRKSRRQSNRKRNNGKVDGSPIRIIENFDQENIDPKELLRKSLRKSFGGSNNEDDPAKVMIRESLEEFDNPLNTLRKVRDNEQVSVNRVFEKREFGHDFKEKQQPLVSFEKYLEEHRMSRKKNLDFHQRIPMPLKQFEIKKSLPECLVCYETLEPESTLCISECKHSFHNGCLKQYLETKIDDRSFPITCPMDGCSVGVPESDIIKLLDKDFQDKFYSYSLRHFAETNRDSVFFCVTPDCEYFTFIDETTRSFYCVTCLKAFCVKCKSEWHDDLSCEANKLLNEPDDTDEKFNEYVASSGCKQCPRCSYYVHKVDGCNHMTCRCSHEFCYGCGQNMDACLCEG